MVETVSKCMQGRSELDISETNTDIHSLTANMWSSERTVECQRQPNN